MVQWYNSTAMQLLNVNIMSARKCLITFLCLFLTLQVCSQKAGKGIIYNIETMKFVEW